MAYDPDLTYGALADPTRRALLNRLRRTDARVTELAEPFDLSLNAISKHLRVLERAGLVRRRVQGREHHISLNVEPLLEARIWLDSYHRFWEKRVDALDSFLRARKTRERKRSS